jgi:hypothetical protein
LKESDFWSQLEYRVCHELDEIEECRRKGFWCDGFIPENYVLDDPFPYISGRVWIGIGSLNQQEWEFTLFLSKSAEGSDKITWSELLPPNNLTQWIEVDFKSKRLNMEPSAGVLDGS